MFYFFLLGVAALGALVYLGLFFAHVPGASEERLGVWEPLPKDLNEWCDRGLEDGLVREERYLFDDSAGGPGKLSLQVRFRDPVTRAIVRIAPETLVPRRRVRES